MARGRSMIEFSEGVTPVLDYWRDSGWDLRDILNAGAILWHEATPEQREAAMAKANRAPGAVPSVIPATKFRELVREIIREYEADAMRAAGEAVVEQAAAEARAEGRRGKRARKTG